MTGLSDAVGALDDLAPGTTAAAVHRIAWTVLMGRDSDPGVVAVVDGRQGPSRIVHGPAGATHLLLLDERAARLVTKPIGVRSGPAQDGGELLDLSDFLTDGATATPVDHPLDVLWAAAAAGLAVESRRLLDLTRARVRTRSQFGQNLSSFQAVQHRLADALVDVEAIELAVEEAVAAIDEGTSPVGAAATGKLLANDAAIRVRATAHQLCGGYGYLEEAGLGPSTRSIHVLTAGIGPTPDLRSAITEALRRGPHS